MEQSFSWEREAHLKETHLKMEETNISMSTPSERHNTVADRTHPHRSPEVDEFVDRFLTVMCDTSRRYILELLAMPAEDGESLVERRSGDIARAIGLSAATTSEHLHQLTRLGLVTARRVGNTVYYRLRNRLLMQAFQEILMALEQHYREINPGNN
jgi:DNA-binding transcriptional ArsR family regulator